MRISLLALLVLALPGGVSTVVSAAGPCFGFYELRDGVPYATSEGVWTFDHGMGPNEGWVADQVYDPPGPDVVRWQSLEDFSADGFPAGAPIIDGNGMIWAGVHADEAEELCYECGLGFGVGVQRMRSPWIPYSGGDVTLAFDYFQDMPHNSMYVVVQSDVDPYLYANWEYADGNAGAWNDPVNFLDMIHADQLTGASAIIVEFYLAVTGGPSDEDCSFDSQWGAFGIDNVIVAGGAQASFDFEDGPQGWETLAGGLNRDPQLVFEVRDLAAYGRGYENWMDCPLDANVMTLHGPGVFQEETLQGATSPIIDLTGLGDPHITGFSVTWDELRDYAGTSPGIESRIYYRTYPRPCATGAPPRWSNWELAFQDGVSGDEGCLALADNFWSGAQGVPDFLQVHVAVWTCAACCPIYCEGADVTPFFDNLQVCMRLAPSDVEDHEAAGDLGVRLSSQPVSPRSTARLGQQARGEVGVDLFSASGRRLAALFRGSVGSDSELPIGSWLDEQGLTPGLYFVRFHTETSGETVKVVWAP